MVKPKQAANHPPKAGQGKHGRVNASESSDASLVQVTETMVDDGDDGQMWPRKMAVLGADTPARRREGTRPMCSSSMGNVTTRMASGRKASRWTVRETESASRRRKVSEAKAIGRKTQGRHNLMDRVLPALKDG